MNRRTVIVTALGAVAAELVASIWYPVPVYIACSATGLIMFVAAVIVAWPRRRQPWAAFLVDERDRSFRTPVHADNLLLGLACLQFAALGLAVSRVTWAGLAVGLLFGSLVAGLWRALWRGAGLTLRPGGIEAGKTAGALVIPWEALGPEQPTRGDNWWQLKLHYARPELVTSTGWTLARDEAVFEDGDPDFVAKAIATYAAEPDRRHAIGTRAELERLQAGEPGQRRRRIREYVEPAPTGTTVRRVIVGLVLLALCSAAAYVADRRGWPDWVSFPFGWFGGRQLYLAGAGWRAARRARRAARSRPREGRF
ncbi:hypothetical protein [Micromonospora sp. NPDC093277]|uniref:hypothetical protein n=1 Tax=Micromonospora sp. NPDC093277 TaxID=3364291 RepID=UPI00382BF833